MLFGWRGGVNCLDETTVISKITSVLEAGYEYDMSIEGKMTLKTVFKVSKPENFKIGVNNIPIPFLSFPISGFQISDANKEAVKIFMKKFLEKLPRKPWMYEKKEKVGFYRHLRKFIKFYLLPIVLVDILLLYLGYVDIAWIIGAVSGAVLGLAFVFSLAPNLIPFMAKIQWRKWVK